MARVRLEKVLQVLVRYELVRVDGYLVHAIAVGTLQIALAVLARHDALVAGARAALEESRIVDDMKRRHQLAHDEIEEARAGIAVSAILIA